MNAYKHVNSSNPTASPSMLRFKGCDLRVKFLLFRYVIDTFSLQLDLWEVRILFESQPPKLIGGDGDGTCFSRKRLAMNVPPHLCSY